MRTLNWAKTSRLSPQKKEDVQTHKEEKTGTNFREMFLKKILKGQHLLQFCFPSILPEHKRFTTLRKKMKACLWLWERQLEKPQRVQQFGLTNWQGDIWQSFMLHLLSTNNNVVKQIQIQKCSNFPKQMEKWGTLFCRNVCLKFVDLRVFIFTA